MSGAKVRVSRRAAYALIGLFFLPWSGAAAHQTPSELSTTFSISGIKLTPKGPFKPGDLITFEVVSNLPLDQFHFMQITGECLTYPAEWHEGSEGSYLDNSRAKLGKAVAVVSSGCQDGEHLIQEVFLISRENAYARLTSDSATLPKYEITQGHFVASQPREKKSDSLIIPNLPKATKLAANGYANIANLPRVTSHGQTISWTALGACRIKKEFGQSDLGGQVIADKRGKCHMSANTPWGSHLYNPVNIALEVSIYSSNALECRLIKGKTVLYTEVSKCPKGYMKK